MNKIFLSKSKYCQGVQCKKILWLNEYNHDCAKDDEDEPPVFATGREVGELARGLLGEYHNIPYDENYEVMIEKTEELLKDKPIIITEASFIYENNFCRVDILKNDLDGVEIYEVKSSTKIKPIHLDDVAYQYFVLSSLGLTVKKAAIVYLNSKTYIRGKELDITQLFNIDDVTNTVKQKQDEVRNNIERINSFIEEHDKDNEPKIDIGGYCSNPYPCVYWQYCTGHLPEHNVFDIAWLNKDIKFDKYYNGKISFEDLENDEDIIKDKRFKEQIDFELNNREPKIEKEAIKEFLSSLKYPLYFIDYEACQYAIPKYEGTFSYQQIPFQYSLHIIQNEGAPLEHKEFLAQVDDENMIRNFAESMIEDLSENGSVIVYNKTFEKSLVNKKIGEMYPDLKQDIERINGNIVDLMQPFSKRQYYTKEMEGSSSLKSVLPALYPDDPELDYDKLPLVHNGAEAPQAFLSLKDESPEKQEEIRDGLLKYCELDTLAMVKIWEKFKEVTKD